MFFQESVLKRRSRALACRSALVPLVLARPLFAFENLVRLLRRLDWGGLFAVRVGPDRAQLLLPHLKASVDLPWFVAKCGL